MDDGLLLAIAMAVIGAEFRSGAAPEA